MKLFKYLLILFVIIINYTLNAQSVGNYSVSRTTSVSYSSIASSGNSFSSWRNTAAFSQDDNRSFQTNIGFDFWYNGTRYTQFSASTNGFIDFSASTADGTGTGAYGYSNPAFYGDGSGTWLSIAPFYDDMTAEGGVGALGSSVKYLVSGSAPNRVLTVEWINMAVYGNTSPDLDFQVKLYETTGVIEFVYDTMSAGTASFSYTCGINAATLSNTPTAAQLKCQQTANSTTFNNGQVGNLATLPTAQSRITLTPPSTTPSPSGVLSFSAVSSTGMTVSWTNWCTNELGYVLYNSTDGTNYSFVAQTAANATSYAATGLLPSTLYYWKMYAVTEGALSTSINGTQSTSAAGNKTSTGTGSWNTAGTWTPSGVPTAGDNVTIANGHTVTINTDAVCNNLTVGQGTSGILSIGNNTTARIITVNSNLTISNGASFITNTASDATHTITVEGNITNNGTLNFRSDANSLCNATFNINGNKIISGSGGTNSFNLIAVSLGTSKSNTLEITSTNFSAPTNFLTLTYGTFKLSTSGTVNITPYTGLATINSNTAFICNSSTATVNFSGGINLYGDLSVINGTVNIGDATDENLQSFGGNFSISGGTTNIAGRYFTPDINNPAYFSMSNGSLILPTSGSTSTTIAPFHINAPGSTFTMSNGTINIQREGGTGAQDLGFLLSNLTSNSITGGTLQFGNGSSPASQNIIYNSSYNIGGFSVSSSNVTAQLNTNLTSLGAVTISSGTLNANNYSVSLRGNWTNNGNFTAGTGTVTLNGTSAQSMSGSSTTNFTNLTINNTSGVNISSGTYSLSDVLTVNNGTFNSGGNSFTLLSNASKTARIAPVTGTGAFSGNFIIERYIPSRSSLTWANLSSPVSSTTVQDWDNELWFYYPYNFGVEVGNILIYDETIADYVQVSPTTTITPEMGFEIYLMDDATAGIFSNTTINTIGTPNYGTQVYNLEYTPAISPYEGQNLVGNPFASAIQVNQIVTTNALATVDVYDNASGNYLTLSGTDLIAPHQGFWAYATSAGSSISIPESAKSTSSTQNIKSIKSDSHLNLTIESADSSHSFFHTLKIGATETASNDFDNADHPFRKSPNKKAPFIAANTSSYPLSICTFNSNQNTFDLQLSTYAGIQGKYKISVSGIENTLKDFECVVLEDKFLNTKTNLKTTNSYLFSATPSDYQNRFVLHFEKNNNCELTNNSSIVSNNEIEISQTINGASIKFNNTSLSNVYLSIKNVLGQEIANNHTLGTSINSITELNLPYDYKGIYIVEVRANNQLFSKKFVK